MVKPGRNKPRKWDPSLIGTTDHFVPSGKPIPEELIAAALGKRYARGLEDDSKRKSQDS